MGKRIRNAVIVLFLGMQLLGCQTMQYTIQGEVESYTDLDVHEGEVIEHYDSHGGFTGDGLTLAVVEFSDGSILEQIAGQEDWKPLPLSFNINSLVYERGYLETEEDSYVIPEITNGYYYFYDRHSESVDHHDDSELCNRYSYNFIIAIYDVDTDTLYYARLDT